MKKRDQLLGMHAAISRRDFMNGVGIAIGSSLIPAGSLANSAGRQDMADYYPPALTGMRGSHPGSFEMAHAARDGTTWEAVETGEEYDLVVVGAGISGLAAAFFYRQQFGEDKRILLIDNHDDFGGHAKRNEFVAGDRLMIGYGGTQSLESPSSYPAVAKQLLHDLGIEPQRFYKAFDQSFVDDHELRRGTFFDKESFGRDHLAIGSLTDAETLAQLPLSKTGKADLVRLFEDEDHYLYDIPADERLTYLNSISYLDYLRKHAEMSNEVLSYMSARSNTLWAISIDALPARSAWSSDYPGFGDLDLNVEGYRNYNDEPYIFHFPDGNSSVARLLVRNMIPQVAAGDSMEDIVTARFDYSKLDQPDSRVRVRLSSTGIRVRHIDDDLSNAVDVTYLRDGKGYTVTGSKVVLAGYHSLIPRLCPEMPAAQREACATAVRAPMVYTNVLISNWQSFSKLGIHSVYSPYGFHSSISLDFPVSLGDYSFPKSPGEPMILHCGRTLGEPGLDAKEQFVAGRRKLLDMSFETFERETRAQLNRLLGNGGFDAARDIQGITVNRWPHGYAYTWDPASNRIAFEDDEWDDSQKHWLRARRPFGNITIANTDAASNAMTESAIVEAHRAVSELA